MSRTGNDGGGDDGDGGRDRGRGTNKFSAIEFIGWRHTWF